MFLKICHEKSAQTDVSKEMWVPNAKGLKHLNTVILLLMDRNCSFDQSVEYYDQGNKAIK